MRGVVNFPGATEVKHVKHDACRFPSRNFEFVISEYVTEVLLTERRRSL